MDFPMSNYPPGCSGPPDVSDHDECQRCGGELDGNGDICGNCAEDLDDYHLSLIHI